MTLRDLEIFRIFPVVFIKVLEDIYRGKVAYLRVERDENTAATERDFLPVACHGKCLDVDEQVLLDWKADCSG